MTNETRDALRNRLAERLLEVGLKECAPESYTDTHEEVEVGEGGKTYADCRASLTLREWYVKHAEAALAAATVIYPVEAADWTQAVSREESLVDQAGDVDASELPIREGA